MSPFSQFINLFNLLFFPLILHYYFPPPRLSFFSFFLSFFSPVIEDGTQFSKGPGLSPGVRS